MSSAADQQQLNILQKAMEKHMKVEQMEEENDKIRQQIQTRQETFERLNQLSLAAATLLGSVDSSAPVTEMSSAKCLSKLEESDAVNGENDHFEDDQVKIIVGKYINHLLSKLVDFAERNPEQIDIFGMQEIEDEMSQLYIFGEDKKIIPTTKPTEGWKQSAAVHHQLFEKLHSYIEDNK
ncbi:hypothetical protein TVAG_222880 [Trichomonas vaginalis G3]|uniref:Uncharacterized protein n=1 Tax=Trichomonas vaginalis (strain ATCC PRA-98 / G3) TaxID=412133 RepID=A2FHY2_TRIV3|nr:hypothetical protein TVAGG3_0347640 [Trichomonas vaginalis G3]EAX95491.1 hypothetical protein TVAG_222880 [Trichomonas vaginalis G3]KAI5531076.1 hypothetical protein TVAGG3_0347640 [Trichomonas vaginalis G3]|eukprot:XP_001308421.1 hypothetical protein [Trichomonas vaginalis G3]